MKKKKSWIYKFACFFMIFCMSFLMFTTGCGNDPGAFEEMLGEDGEIDTENEDYQNILMMRFINEMMWEDIASELAVSYSTCKRWYYFALTEFEKLNGDERL